MSNERVVYDMTGIKSARELQEEIAELRAELRAVRAVAEIGGSMSDEPGDPAVWPPPLSIREALTRVAKGAPHPQDAAKLEDFILRGTEIIRRQRELELRLRESLTMAFFVPAMKVEP